jgi:heme/copper-type cytochrome/quinol oxidase subunit 4
MNGQLITHTLLFRLMLILTMLGGAIAMFSGLEANSNLATAAQTTARQQLSLQLSSW